jgi:hypothetical protein
MTTDMPRMRPVMSGGVCAGFLVSLGPRGVEAFDRNEHSLGTFAGPIEAANAIENAARGAACTTCSE